jgi:hypothetical protein
VRREENCYIRGKYCIARSYRSMDCNGINSGIGAFIQFKRLFIFLVASS